MDVARDMGADTIIAVDISTGFWRATLSTVLDITTQLTNMLTRTGAGRQRAKLAANDVLLLPTFDQE